MRAWRDSTILCLVALLLVTAALPAQAGDDRGPAAPRYLNVGSLDQMKIRNILPAIATEDPHTIAVLARVYDTPVQRNATTGAVVPRLAVGIDQNGNGRLDGPEAGVFNVPGTTVTVFYNFTNAFFHDRVPVSAMDILFSYHLLALDSTASGPIRPLMDRGGGVGSNFTVDRWLWALPVDDGDGIANTSAIRFTLASEYAPFPWATLGIPVLPRHVWEDTGGGRHTDFGKAVYPEGDPRVGRGIPTWETLYRPFSYTAAEAWAMLDSDVIGSGHFRFGTWVFGSFARLDTNPDYAFGAPKYDGIVFRTYRTTQLLIFALLSGEIDLILGTFPPEFLPDLRADPNIGLIEAPDLLPKVLAFNLRRLPFGYDAYPPTAGSDIGLPFRRAMTHLIDLQTIVRVLLQDHGVKAEGMVSRFNDGWYNDTLPVYPYDLPLAEAILDNEGWVDTDADGWREFPRIGDAAFDMITPQADYNPILAAAGAMIASTARSVGVNMNSRPTAWGLLLSSVLAGTFDLAIFPGPDVLVVDPWTLSLGDPDYLYDHFHSMNAVAGRNRAGFWNATFDSVSDRSRAVADFANRSREVGWEQGILAVELPFIPLYYPNNTWAFRNDTFTGWTLVGSTVFNYWSLQNLEPAPTPPTPPNPGPVIILNSPPDGAIFPRGTAIDLTVTDSDLSSVQYTIDGGSISFLYSPWDIDTSSWTEGVHALDVTAMDSVGNTTTERYTFTVDSLPPAIDLVAPANNSLVPGGTTLDFSVSDPHLMSASIRIDSGAPAGFAPPYDVSMAGLADGRHTFVVEAADAAGNVASREFAVTLDATAPTVVDSGPRGNITVTVSGITARFSEPVNRSSVEVAFTLTDGVRTWDAANGTFFWATDNRSFVFIPDADLARDTLYQVRLAGTLTDDAGNPMGSDAVWSFRFPSPPPSRPGGVDPLWIAAAVLLIAAVAALLALLMRRRPRGERGPPDEPKP